MIESAYHRSFFPADVFRYSQQSLQSYILFAESQGKFCIFFGIIFRVRVPKNGAPNRPHVALIDWVTSQPGEKSL
jgi:hypothetical protein